MATEILMFCQEEDVFYILAHLSFFHVQVFLAFQRVAAEILGVKLNKAEMEQSQVSLAFIRPFISHFPERIDPSLSPARLGYSCNLRQHSPF